MLPAANFRTIYFDSSEAACPLPVLVSVVGVELLLPTVVAPLFPVSQKEVPPSAQGCQSVFLPAGTELQSSKPPFVKGTASAVVKDCSSPAVPSTDTRYW